ncbi:MAG: type II toxin-antitoxin system VapC family toxin [Chloroflexi bacterium]|nr:type II toxin-antitoxin system VapC family toxin [Chloroflexota bacterium]MDA8186704.1 type II toxin-antitoxin system VapC family toxin [Dehalococcoidales bacterium]
MNAILVDTDVLIDFLRGRPEARGFLLALSERAALHCSVVTVAELYAGVRKSEEQKTAQLIAGMVVAQITQEIAETAGRLRRNARGFSLDLDDCFIAATALAEGASLATRNAKHYPFDSLELIVPAYH